MIITSRHKNPHSRLRDGFTLVELIVSTAIASIFVTIVLSVLLLMTKGSFSLTSYSRMSSQGRVGLEYFSRDTRSANSISVSSPFLYTDPDTGNSEIRSSVGVTFTYPDFYGSNVQAVYTYDSLLKTLTRVYTYGGNTTRKVLLRDVDSFHLSFYQIPSNMDPTDSSTMTFNNLTEIGPLDSVNDWTASIRLDAELKRSLLKLNRTVASNENTDEIISARFTMRNNLN